MGAAGGGGVGILGPAESASRVGPRWSFSLWPHPTSFTVANGGQWLRVGAGPRAWVRVWFLEVPLARINPERSQAGSGGGGEACTHIEASPVFLRTLPYLARALILRLPSKQRQWAIDYLHRAHTASHVGTNEGEKVIFGGPEKWCTMEASGRLVVSNRYSATEHPRGTGRRSLP